MSLKGVKGVKGVAGRVGRIRHRSPSLSLYIYIEAMSLALYIELQAKTGGKRLQQAFLVSLSI